MAVLCRGLEKNGMFGARHASVNHAWPHSANQMGKKHSKPLAARHAMCQSAFTGHEMFQVHSATKKKVSWNYCLFQELQYRILMYLKSFNDYSVNPLNIRWTKIWRYHQGQGPNTNFLCCRLTTRIAFLQRWTQDTCSFIWEATFGILQMKNVAPRMY